MLVALVVVLGLVGIVLAAAAFWGGVQGVIRLCRSVWGLVMTEGPDETAMTVEENPPPRPKLTPKSTNGAEDKKVAWKPRRVA